jgi:hypothetical protein
MKVSNEIINRCRTTISLQDIFAGDVEVSIIVLEESIAAGEAWKQLYQKSSESVAAASNGEATWNFEVSNIFAQIDAFVQVYLSRLVFLKCRDVGIYWKCAKLRFSSQENQENQLKYTCNNSN